MDTGRIAERIKVSYSAVALAAKVKAPACQYPAGAPLAAIVGVLSGEADIEARIVGVGAGAAFATAMFAAPGSTASTRTCAEPCFNMPSRAAAAYERSMMRPSWKGPRSLMRTTTDLPFSRWVTRT